MGNDLSSNVLGEYSVTDVTKRRTVLLWIQARIAPVAKESHRRRMCSYELKHIMERENGQYVTNDQIKGAMFAANYPAYRTHDINWLYCVRVKPKGDAA